MLAPASARLPNRPGRISNRRNSSEIVEAGIKRHNGLLRAAEYCELTAGKFDHSTEFRGVERDLCPSNQGGIQINNQGGIQSYIPRSVAGGRLLS
jgi:hypothetical protein